MNYGIGMSTMNMGNIQPMNPYQDKYNRYMDLQQQAPIQQQTQSTSPFVTVSNIQEAKEKVVPYNCTMWMRDSSEPYLYVKTVDVTGSPTFTVLKLENVTDNVLYNVKQNTNVEYVSIEQYRTLEKSVQELKAFVDALNKPIEKPTQTPNKKVGDK